MEVGGALDELPIKRNMEIIDDKRRYREISRNKLDISLFLGFVVSEIDLKFI